MDVVAELVRSGFVEGHHYGIAVHVGSGGDVEWSLGDPETVVFPRSANKPFQALGMMRAGLPLEGKLLALASASHSGEPFHFAAVREVLAMADLDEGALQTPPSYPMEQSVRDAYIRGGGVAAPICMDCSGKHAAMLLTCVRNGWSIDNYLDPGHPLQVVIAETFAELTGAEPAAIGVDGCGAPLFATSLRRLARGIGSFMTAPAGLPEQRLVAAMSDWPAYVSGTTRDEIAMMQVFPGALAKSGAEAVYVLGMPGGDSFAVKIDDGGDRARPVVMARMLEIAGYEHPILHDRPEILGGGKQVGSIRATF